MYRSKPPAHALPNPSASDGHAVYPTPGTMVSTWAAHRSALSQAVLTAGRRGSSPATRSQPRRTDPAPVAAEAVSSAPTTDQDAPRDAADRRESARTTVS